MMPKYYNCRCLPSQPPCMAAFDLEVLGFEQVASCAKNGTRDFQRSATLVRLWDRSEWPEWTHITHRPIGVEGSILTEVFAGSGEGIAELIVYLNGDRP